MSQAVAGCRTVSQGVAGWREGVASCRRTPHVVAGLGHKLPQPQEKGRFGHRGNIYFLLKLNPKLVSDHPESGRSETQLGIECLGRGAIVALPQVNRVRGD